MTIDSAPKKKKTIIHKCFEKNKNTLKKELIRYITEDLEFFFC